jgi:Trk K+ transport system NAD-binding subunit
MYIIIVGAGEIGTALVGLATQFGNEVVAIEKSDENTPSAPNRLGVRHRRDRDTDPFD